MGLITQAASRLFSRGDELRQFDKADYDVVTGGISTSRTAAGRGLTLTKAQTYSAVHACATLISDDIAQLPTGVFSRTEDSRIRRASPRWLDEPNEDMTAFGLFEAYALSLCYRGNSYFSVTTSSTGIVEEVWPLDPSIVSPFRQENGRVAFKVALASGEERVVQRYRRGEGPGIVHVPWYPMPGSLEGADPIRRMAEAVALGLTIEEFGSNHFQNGSHMSGIIEVPGVLEPEDAREISSRFTELHGGAGKSGLVGVLDDGAKFTTVSFSPENAQFLQTRQHQITEVARWFRVPPHLIGDVERSTSWGTGIEEQSIGYVTHTILPLVIRAEQALSRLLPRGQNLSLNVDGLVRANITSRYEAYAKGRQNGWLSANDVLRLENRNPVEGGDVYLQPLNMVDAATAAEIQAGFGSNKPEEGDQ